MEIKTVSINAYETVTNAQAAGNGYVSDFSTARLYFAGSAESSYKEKADAIVLYVKQAVGNGLRFDSLYGLFQEGTMYQLKLKVDQLSAGNLLMLPLDANNNQINMPTYDVVRSSSAETGEMEYTVTFTAPSGLYNLELYCIGGTNEMEIKTVSINANVATLSEQSSGSISKVATAAAAILKQTNQIFSRSKVFSQRS